MVKKKKKKKKKKKHLGKRSTEKAYGVMIKQAENKNKNKNKQTHTPTPLSPHTPPHTKRCMYRITTAMSAQKRRTIAMRQEMSKKKKLCNEARTNMT